ncbi:MAG: hypothetical protein LBV47_01935 [Bacteroidales bacterium]|jgi:hypothetical protein|nr:hypothetical protein [Bacteroidales bacterium]
MERQDSSSQLFDLYKLYVELTDRISQRRGHANMFFLSVISTLVGLTGFIYPSLHSEAYYNVSVIFMICIFGILMCVIWYLIINSYKQLNKIRFTIIAEMEQNLVFNCFSREWQLLKEKKLKYRRLSGIEKFVPLLFMVPFIFFMIINLI